MLVTNQANFVNNNYFYDDFAECGLNWEWQALPDWMEPNGDISDLPNLLRSKGLNLWLRMRNLNGGSGDLAWVSESTEYLYNRSNSEHCLPVWGHDDFWHWDKNWNSPPGISAVEGRGNAMNPAIDKADRLEDGFIIGSALPSGDDIDVDDNWVRPKVYHAFDIEDEYDFTIYVKKLHDMDDVNDVILSLYVAKKVGENIVQYNNSPYTLTDGEFDVESDEDEATFFIDEPVVPGNALFALQWNGIPDPDGAGPLTAKGDLEIHSMSYRGDLHKKVLPRDGEDVDFQVDFISNFEQDNAVLNEDVPLGYRSWEPRRYGIGTYLEVAEHLSEAIQLYKPVGRNVRLLRDVNGGYGNYYPVDAQFHTLDAYSFEEFIGESKVEILTLDRHPFLWGMHGEDDKRFHPDVRDAGLGWGDAYMHVEETIVNGNGDGTGIVLYDQPFTNTINGGGDVEVDLISVQDGLDGYFYGRWFDKNGQAEFYPSGIYYGALEAKDTGIDLNAGINASGVLSSKDIDGANHPGRRGLDGFAEPTPRMIKCQGFMAMTCGAKGFFYSYYGCQYQHNFTDVATPPFEDAERFKYFNGATISGLVTFVQNNDGNTWEITAGNEFNAAAKGVSPTGLLWGDVINGPNGGLPVNEKWAAAKEFNHYVRTVEHAYANLTWLGTSECASRDNEIGSITIESTNEPGEADDDSMFVQVGLFSNQHFMMANRRCDVDGDREIDFTIDRPVGLETYNLIEYDEDGTRDVIASGVGDLEVNDYLLPAATGRLFFITRGGLPQNITDSQTWRGNYLIDDPITISSTGSLTVLPNTIITFVDDGKFTVYGDLQSLGKLDDQGDSLVIFTSQDASAISVIELYGNQTDQFLFTHFTHLPQGLKVSKGATSTLDINCCEFSYNDAEGLSITSGLVVVDSSLIHHNGTDGMYLYNTTATITYTDFTNNSGNGLYAYSVNSNSTVSYCGFMDNGSNSNSYPEGGIRFYNCSPTIAHSDIRVNREYGLYGANGSYPVMYDPLLLNNAANTITGNVSHETYWDYSWPLIDEGHNNFDVADDTIIFITASTPLTQFDAENNYWGNTSGPDYPGTDGSDSYKGPGGFDFTPYQTTTQSFIGGEAGLDPKNGGKNGFGGIADNNRDAVIAFKAALNIESEHPARAIAAYRSLISEYSTSPYAPMAVERLLWMIRNNTPRLQRDQELDRLTRYFQSLADTSESRALVWKARRAALWSLAAQHRYDEAIGGFEAIIQENECLSDSVYAVIDAGTLHLEALEWARQDSLNHIQSIFGRRQELCPASFPAHRKKTDELLALLNGTNGGRKSLIPNEFFLEQNYPNPFNPATTISYGLPQASKMTLKIFDVMGREVATLVDGQQRTGYYKTVWQGVNQSGLPVSSGMYFIRMEAGQFVKTQKMTLVK